MKWKTFHSDVPYCFISVCLFFFLHFYRRRMRCSTNIYLTALAVADIVNLFCAFVLSLQHYPSFTYGHVLYWSAYGLSNWFHDASRMYDNNIAQHFIWQKINHQYSQFVFSLFGFVYVDSVHIDLFNRKLHIGALHICVSSAAWTSFVHRIACEKSDNG